MRFSFTSIIVHIVNKEKIPLAVYLQCVLERIVRFCYTKNNRGVVCTTLCGKVNIMTLRSGFI